MTTNTAQSPAWRSPDSLISAALCLFAFSVVFSVTVVQIALFLAIIGLLIKKHREKTLSGILPSLARHPLFIPWLVYLGVCLLTALTAYYPAKGFGQLNSDFLKYVCLSALLLAVKKEHLPRLLVFYVLAAAISAVAGISETALSVLRGDPEIVRAGAMMNPVRYAEVMLIALTLTAARLLFSADDSPRMKVFLAAAGAAAFLALVLTQTRGAYLGAVTSILFMFYFSKGKRLKLLGFTAVLLVLAGISVSVIPEVKGRLVAMVDRNPEEMLTNTPSTAINIRLELWKLGLTMFQAHPVVGVGPDNVKKVFKKFHPGPVGYPETWGSLHNLYIHQAAERGLLGLGALVFLFGSLFAFALSRFKAAASPYALWAVCALPAFYVVNLTEISFQHVHTSFAIFMALAFAAAAERETV